MKNFVLFILAIIVTLNFSSCERKSGRRIPVANPNTKVMLHKSDTVVFIPEKLGVTDLEVEYTPYPEFDGGTGIEISYSVGAEYLGKIYEVHCDKSYFYPEKLTKFEAENSLKAGAAVMSYKALSKAQANKLLVVALKGKIIKIYSPSTITEDRKFTPKHVYYFTE